MGKGKILIVSLPIQNWHIGYFSLEDKNFPYFQLAESLPIVIFMQIELV